MLLLFGDERRLFMAVRVFKSMLAAVIVCAALVVLGLFALCGWKPSVTDF